MQVRWRQTPRELYRWQPPSDDDHGAVMVLPTPLLAVAAVSWTTAGGAEWTGTGAGRDTFEYTSAFAIPSRISSKLLERMFRLRLRYGITDFLRSGDLMTSPWAKICCSTVASQWADGLPLREVTGELRTGCDESCDGNPATTVDEARVRTSTTGLAATSPANSLRNGWVMAMACSDLREFIGTGAKGP